MLERIDRRLPAVLGAGASDGVVAPALDAAEARVERTSKPTDRPSGALGSATGAAMRAARAQAVAEPRAILEPLLADTWRGLSAHFLTALGLPIDRLRLCPTGQVTAQSFLTSPTNLGLYLAALVVQRDRGMLPQEEAAARAALTLETIGRMAKDPRGFLYNWYDARDAGVSGAERYVSSVDNGNLMVALVGLRQAFAAHPTLGRAIEGILAPMRRSFAGAFLERDPASPAAGTLRLGYRLDGQGREVPAPHHYDRLGSEVRSVVALLEAQGDLPEGSLARLAARTDFVEAQLGAHRARVFKTWDGGVFQWLLPEILLGESALSPEMQRSHRDLARLLVAEGRDGVPMASSACDLPDGRYEGKSGVPALAEDRSQVLGGAVTPHALFLLSSVAPAAAARGLSRLLELHPGLYHSGLGFADSVDLASGAEARTFLALDQLMSVIAGGDFGRHLREAAPGLAEVYARVELTPPRTAARAALETALAPARFECTVPETQALLGRRVELQGGFDFGRLETEADGQRIRVEASPGAGRVLGGQRYLEFPNSTSLTTTDPQTGALRELVLTRGVRPYQNTLAPGSSNAPQGYVSDVLLFERVRGRLEYRRTLLRSRPETNFLFEDPRVSVLELPGRGRTLLLSGTDYSPHREGTREPDVMNRYLELALDARGLPEPVAVDPRTHRPRFRDLSPPPRPIGAGHAFVDAKNGTVALNESGEVVVRTRMRPDFDRAPEYAAVKDRVPRWAYGEQVYTFASWEDFQAYDFRHALEDLFDGGGAGDAGVRPVRARVVATDQTFKELYPHALLAPGKARGFGPGTPPVRLARKGDALYVAEGKGAPEQLAGRIPPALAARFPIREGHPMYLSFDHQLRVLEDRREGTAVPKRVYSAALKLWEPSLEEVALVYADALQPRQAQELGGSGILDLHHVYPMGRVILPSSARAGEVMVRVYAGAADAHTESFDFDVVALLGEMAEGSARRSTGQVYRP